MTSQREYLDAVKEKNEYAAKIEGKSGQSRYNDSEPVICSKCNITFDTDAGYMQHYDEKHKLEYFNM